MVPKMFDCNNCAKCLSCRCWLFQGERIAPVFCPPSLRGEITFVSSYLFFCTSSSFWKGVTLNSFLIEQTRFQKKSKQFYMGYLSQFLFNVKGRHINHVCWPRQAKTCIRAYANSDGPDQPAHPQVWSGPSLSADRIIRYYRMSKGPDYT